MRMATERGSRARACQRMCVARRRLARSCRSCICTGSQAETSSQPLRSSSAVRLVFRRRASPGSPSERWQSERESFMSRDLSRRDYVYVWVDGIHTGVRLGQDERLCSLVMVGTRLDGAKELVAIQDGYRESEESWAGFLRDLKKRGMRAPVLAIGDGALGFWSALRDVFPETRHQRDWVHRTGFIEQI